jgi:hypothetical protein
MTPADPPAPDPDANLDLRADIPGARAGPIAFAFDFPDLLNEFMALDGEARRLRSWSRRLGVVSILLVFLALATASADPLIAAFGENVHHNLRYFAAAAGMVGTLLGLLGLPRSSFRNRWVGHRFRAELLRHFHFHYLAARVPSLVAAAGDPALEAAYGEHRASALATLKSRYLDLSGAELTPLIEAPERVSLEEITPIETTEPERSEPAALLFAAWRKLRLDWQQSYSASKLDSVRIGLRTPRQQGRILSTLSWACIAAVMILHATHFGEPWLHLTAAQGAFAQLLIVWIALLALAIRALEDGLAPQREVERYEQYRIRIETMAESFDRARTDSVRLAIMRAFELTSRDEMNLFIRTHSHSRFLL